MTLLQKDATTEEIKLAIQHITEAAALIGWEVGIIQNQPFQESSPEIVGLKASEVLSLVIYKSSAFDLEAICRDIDKDVVLFTQEQESEFPQ